MELKFDELPSEMIINIYKYMNIIDILKFIKINKRCHNLLYIKPYKNFVIY